MSSSLRFLVQVAFAYTCIEGFIVNLTYPNVLAYVVKDVVILLAYLSLASEQRPAIGSLKKLGGAVMAFCVLTFFFLMMPTPVSLVAELVAIKQRLFYIPLMYVGYFYIRDEHDLYGLLKLMAWTAIPTALFGIYLFFGGPQALRALGGTYSAVFNSTAGAAGVTFWRVPGTFTSPGQYALYLLIQATLMTGMLFTPSVPRSEKTIPLIALVLSLAAMLASGSRTPLVVYVLCVGLMLFYMGKLTGLGTAALAGYAVMTVIFTYFGAGVQDRVGSILSQENYDRAQSVMLGQLFLTQIMETPLGMGLGTATIGARHFTDWSQIILIESYFGLIVAEMGLLGLIIWIWLVGRTAFLLLGDRLIMRKATWRPLWYSMMLLVLAIIGLMPSSTIIDSAPGNMYFWFLIGVVVRLADLERVKVSAGQASAMSAYLPQYAANAPQWTGF